MDEQTALPLAALCCQTPRCPAYGKRGWGHLFQHDWVARQTQRMRHLRGRTGKTECSERKGTPWSRAHVTQEQGLAVAHHLAEGHGMRQTARLVGVEQHTVRRWNRLLGEHGGAWHREKVRHVRVREAPGDEMWACVGKKDARCDRTDPADQGPGSQGDHTVVEAETKLAVSLVLGPRTQEPAEALWSACAQRTDHRLPEWMTTDE